MDKNVKIVLGVAVVGGVIALAYRYFNKDEKKSNARGVAVSKTRTSCLCSDDGTISNASWGKCPCKTGATLLMDS